MTIGFDAPQISSDGRVVLHLDGQTYSTPLPVSAQIALVDFVSNGGGFISAQWDGYERSQGRQAEMDDLTLQSWGNIDNCGNNCSVIWTIVSGQENHPVLAGIPSSFTFFADGHDATPRGEFATNPSTVLMSSPSGGPAVLVREFGSGRVVNFAHAANYLSLGLTLQNANIQQLYVNAVNWISEIQVAMKSSPGLFARAAAHSPSELQGGFSFQWREKLSFSVSSMRELFTLYVGNSIAAAQNVTANETQSWLTTVIGTVADENGNPVNGATLVVNGNVTGTTRADGSFSISDVPVGLEDISITATAPINGKRLAGSSSPLSPVPNGITNAGKIVLRCLAPLCQ